MGCITLLLEQNQASCAIHLIQGHYLGENLGKTFGILQKFIEICIAITMFTAAT